MEFFKTGIKAEWGLAHFAAECSLMALTDTAVAAYFAILPFVPWSWLREFSLSQPSWYLSAASHMTRSWMFVSFQQALCYLYSKIQLTYCGIGSTLIKNVAVYQ